MLCSVQGMTVHAIAACTWLNTCLAFFKCHWPEQMLELFCQVLFLTSFVSLSFVRKDIDIFEVVHQRGWLIWQEFKSSPIILIMCQMCVCVYVFCLFLFFFILLRKHQMALMTFYTNSCKSSIETQIPLWNWWGTMSMHHLYSPYNCTVAGKRSEYKDSELVLKSYGNLFGSSECFLWSS